MEQQNSKKFIWIALAIVIVAGAVWFIFGKGAKETIQNNTASVSDDSAVVPADSTTAIENDLNSIDIGSVEKELQDVEKDINSL